MGVKELWPLIESCRERVALKEFEGKTVAVDLGFWVCQMQAAVPNPTVLKPHLRSLFFRISALLNMDIRLVFVSEGRPPDLKQDTIRDRQNARRPPANACKRVLADKTVSRTRFQGHLNECCLLIRLLGLPVLESDGEAEAFCAALNIRGLVDAVITDDSDAFLYGATCVLKNFSLEGKEPMVDCYRMQRIKRGVGLDRDKMVALGLLLGCDYCPKGVPGVGPSLAKKFVGAFSSGREVLQRMRCWREGKSAEGTVEAAVLKRVDDPNKFPDERVIHEFMVERRQLPVNFVAAWNHPRVAELRKFLATKLEWLDEYCLTKIIPLVSLWCMRNLARNSATDITLKPIRVVKARVRQGADCFEVQWQKLACDTTTQLDYYITLEKADLFREAYPGMAKDFEIQEQLRKATKKTRKPKKPATVVSEEKSKSSMVVEPENEEKQETEDDLVSVFEKSLILIPDDMEEIVELDSSFRDPDEDLFPYSSDEEASVENEESAENCLKLPQNAVLLDLVENKENVLESPLPLKDRLKLKGLDFSKLKL